MFKKIQLVAAVGLTLTILSASAIAKCEVPKMELWTSGTEALHTNVVVGVDFTGKECKSGELSGRFVFKDAMGKIINSESLDRDHLYVGELDDKCVFKNGRCKMGKETYTKIRKSRVTEMVTANETGEFTVTFDLKDSNGILVASDTKKYRVNPIDGPNIIANNPSQTLKAGTELLLLSSKMDTNCDLQIDFDNQEGNPSVENETDAEKKFWADLNRNVYTCYFEATKDGSILASRIQDENVLVKIPPGMIGSSYSFDWTISKYQALNRYWTDDKVKEILTTGVQTVEYVENTQ